MATPARDPAGLDLAVSDAATPGHTSVAAHFGGDHALDTPGPPSPGGVSPARHRSLEGGRSLQDTGHSNSRGRSGTAFGFDEAAARAAALDSTAAAEGAVGPAEPLSKPRLRVQGADIILEDAASPKADGGTGGSGQQAQLGGIEGLQGIEAARMAALPAAVAAAVVAGGDGPAAQQQQQQQVVAGVSQHQLMAATRASQSHEHELQLRLASRTATGASNMAIASSRHATHPTGPHGEDSRLRSLHDPLAGGEAGPAGGAVAGGVEGPVRMRYRSSLTEENVAYLNKLDQYSSRPDSTGRSSERIWRWLEGSGPPFDNPPPSLGVPTSSKSNPTAASRRQGPKRGFFSCFNCFGEAR